MPAQTLTDTFFDSFDLHPSLIAGLHAAGFTRCTPIQALTLPVALAGHDVAGQAQTGTGKTAAFLVAAMQRLLTKPALPARGPTDPRAVIVAPTRELAIQIEKDFQHIGRGTGLKSALIYGGVDYDKQRATLQAGVDIIIATPGRLIDYFKQHVFSFRAVEVFVLDEADRMFDLGFIKDVRFLMRRLPERDQRQCLLFSATLSHRVLELAYEHMNEAEKLTVETENVTADRVRQLIYFPSTEEKIPLLVNLLSKNEAKRSMIFVNMKIAAEKVARALERQGFLVGMLSGDVPQKKRQSLLGKFQRGDIEILIATDVAARGLHIPDVSHVYNYDLPQDAEDYVHRVGRTARLGAEGDAISFACDMYAQSLPDIEAYIGQKIPTTAIDRAMLVMPPPRPRSNLPTTGVEDEDDGSVPVKGPPPSRSRGSRSPRGERGSRREGGQRPHASSPRPAAVAASEQKLSVAPHSPAAGGETAADGTRRRRRRGGRGRRHGERLETANVVGTEAIATSKGKPATIPTAAIAAPAVAEAKPVAKKSGFFHRVARLFKRS
ncbi:MAG: DEAD/DEAH box helicase [Rudaea sp.]|uniref:DEAD/DEAH box helicase n=1 Tax=Rudaea sp. TaxID=2136325 RepID=UPI0039E37B81